MLFKIALFTFVQAFFSTLIAFTLGLSAAFFTANKKFFFRSFLLSFSSVPLCIPSLLVALGYVSFFGNSGFLNRFLIFLFDLKNPPVNFLYSFAGILICQGFYNFPLVMASVSSAWEKLPAQQKEASLVLGQTPFKTFWKITFFQLFPSIVSSLIQVFLYCFFSFMIVLLFGAVGTTTLEVEIYQRANVNLDFSGSLKFALTETSIALIFIIFLSKIEQKNSVLKGYSFQNNEKSSFSPKEKLFALILFSLIILFFLSPLFSIAANAFSSKKLNSNFTFYNFVKLFKSLHFWNSVKWTFIVSSFTAFFCSVVGFLYCSFIKTFDLKEKLNFLKIIPLFPMAVSSVITGVLITKFTKHSTVFVLITAQVFLTWPVAFRQILQEFEKIEDSTLEAAKILSTKKRDLLFKIYFPLCKGGFFRGMGFCFALSAGDATLPLTLAIRNFDTLSLYTYRLAGSYRFNDACASGVILGLLCMGVYNLSKKIK